MPVRPATVICRGVIGNPAALTVVCSIAAASIPSGTYEIRAYLGYYNANPASANNVRVRRATVSLGTIPDPPVSVAGWAEQYGELVLTGQVFDGTQDCDVQTIADDTNDPQLGVWLTLRKTA